MTLSGPPAADRLDGGLLPGQRDGEPHHRRLVAPLDGPQDGALQSAVQPGQHGAIGLHGLQRPAKDPFDDLFGFQPGRHLHGHVHAHLQPACRLLGAVVKLR
ncbi:MAG: hypothetical protein DLM67_13320 [Candidatus Nephthysia bennettiae]|nr:MAG: hypothetical protein DLM67_13320 [Candidatus Dormibacteraeota bacterium]